jgi:hypothetical protein
MEAIVNQVTVYYAHSIMEIIVILQMVMIVLQATKLIWLMWLSATQMTKFHAIKITALYVTLRDHKLIAC